MISFANPPFAFDFDVEIEKQALRDYRNDKPGRQIPKKRQDNVLIATWNIANLGLQKRELKDYQLIAEMISWFDVVAVQEVHDDLTGLRSIQKNLPRSYKVLFNDRGGNDERAAYIYDSNKVKLNEMVGEVAISPNENRYIRLPNVARSFLGFDRNPFIASFTAGEFSFVLVNVHLFFGSHSKPNVERRSLEAYAIARWADLRHDDEHAYSKNIISLGDFNLPKVSPGDPIYNALLRRGLRRPKHSTKIASNIANDKDYDQIFFFPQPTREMFTGNAGVFDFDGALFKSLYQEQTLKDFLSFIRFHISDHRILWAEFNTQSTRSLL